MLTRRTLLRGAAGSLAVAATARLSPLARADRPTDPKAGGPPVELGRLKLLPLPYGAVKLTGGPLAKQYQYALELMLKFDEDRMLRVYRETAGLPAPGEKMGGWYSADGFCPGHAFGQWVSALARFAAAGNNDTKAKVGRLVEGFSATVGKGKSFYEYRFPCYTFDKQVIGLVDAYRYAGVESAKGVLARVVEAATPHLPEKALTRAEMAARPHKDVTYTWDESYTLPENLFLAGEVFGEERYVEMGKRYLLDDSYFDPLSRGEAAMVGKHAYSHVNALSSAAMAYRLLGSEKHLKAAVNAWGMIVRDQRYASGGWGPNETFVEPGKGKLYESLFNTHNHFETPCGSYGTSKLCRYLMEITGEGHYGDDLERVIYNGILAAKPLKLDGESFYYSDYQAGTHKTYNGDKWPCCSGTYPQVISDYVHGMYFSDGENLYVNLYAPSELHWVRDGGGGVAITQETTYPDSGVVTFRIGQPLKGGLKLRIPSWCEKPEIKRNGQVIAAQVADGFMDAGKDFAAGDEVELNLPLVYRTEAIDTQHPRTVAVMRGPVMEVAVASPPTLSTADPPVGEVEVKFVPFYKIDSERYTTYLNRS